ncbi:hypothetical protein [Sphingomonas sp. Leaf25]|uniref:hypothetical protein n=1 Tax=Sphingomonas sp. Leaf25 TaxID=1735692 RepID=UPI0012E276F4|nr:hypothetical protein [Sphingomonas sp. Leaf25]
MRKSVTRATGSGGRHDGGQPRSTNVTIDNPNRQIASNDGRLAAGSRVSPKPFQVDANRVPQSDAAVFHFCPGPIADLDGATVDPSNARRADPVQDGDPRAQTWGVAFRYEEEFRCRAHRRIVAYVPHPDDLALAVRRNETAKFLSRRLLATTSGQAECSQQEQSR